MSSGRFHPIFCMQIISGMHRSGTSLVARLFYEAGADLGDPRTFYRPDRWNPEGYYEQPDIHAVNMPLVHGRWGRLSYLRLPSETRIRDRGRRRPGQIRELISQYRERVVKDTRFCLTLPAWLDAGAPVTRIVVCLRDPSSVARSLRTRNRIPLWLGHHLWREHNRRLLKHAAGIPLWFVRFENLLDPSRFRGELESVLSFCGLPINGQQAEALRETVVKPSLDHFPSSREPLAGITEPLWGQLCRKHATQSATTLSRGCQSDE